ncbi:interleukin-23 receptor [Dicentrarchus labrax]|uniref:Fibronectin type-III domain-containing protein n=1 Tax=Dicentrarchus labrax TaxID=13489 RepID=A0A8C4HDC6_DICLA|nr:interleukin-23 receptor [Dicentrarchus labrax]XP_051233215.1 interleukin-23 receptor [Dicentrarchus labrax]XP_051233216.1 interleukin-23 receptor [Dicentrarchus labrax]
MNLHSTIWRLIIIFLSFSIKRCPLLPADCQSFNNHGYLTVEPAPLFLIGSNLTVYCHLKECERSEIYLELNGETMAPGKKVNCTMTIFSLFNVRTPQSIMYCKFQSGDDVSGLDLQGGLPPDKPKNIICETSRSSDFINCSWERGKETHLPTVYNISIYRENGTQILLDPIQDAKEITIPRAMMDENTKYQLNITAYNHFGVSESDPVILCVKDIVIPETPNIMQIKFVSNSTAATLQWKTTEYSEGLRPYVRLRTHHGSWKSGEGTELSEGLIQVDGLKPLTEYEFQMRTCRSTSGLTHTSFMPRSSTSKRLFCSKWSPSVRGESPGKGPSQQLHVWRILGSQGTNGEQMVTVLWKPPSPEDHSGEVQQYQTFLGNKQHVTCSAALSHCLVKVPAEVQALSISAVTLYGASPPAAVPLKYSGDFEPVLRELAPAANGSAVLVSWSWPGSKHLSTPGGELLHYVLERTSVSVAELHWQKLPKDQNNTSITGLTAGVRYNISLYAVTTRGVSAPSSGLVYSKEQKPVSGPNLSVLVHEARRILIQWEELPVNHQRGFITNYTIYLQMLDSGNKELSMKVSGFGPRQKWLDCPDGALALQLTASTSAGEGPRGTRIYFQLATPAAGLVLGIVFFITVFLAIIANLMCWSCVRRRIKQKCISWGPAWFDEHLPKPGNSIAIRLLEQDETEPPLSSNYSDPPLSPVSLISQEERDNVYPNVHVEISQVGSGQPTVETHLLMSDAGTMLADSQLEDVSYKPQIATLAAQEQDWMQTEEEERDVPTHEEEDECSNVFGGLLGGFLSSVEVDFSDTPLGLTLRSVSSPLWPTTPETTSVLNGGFFLGRKGTKNDVEADCPTLDLQQGEIMTPDTEDATQDTVETTLTDGYFPQVAVVSSTTLCDTQR